MSKEAMKLALEALESVTKHFTRSPSTLRDSQVRGIAHNAITALRKALAEQPEQQDEECPYCLGSRRMPRDPDIGTDQECFVCDGTGVVETEQPAQQEPVFSFQMQLKPGWGSQYPSPCVIGEPDLNSLFGKIGDVVTFYTSPPARREPLRPVNGDLLPPVGSKVLIHLASQDQWVAHTVVGYYVFGAFDSDRLHRVFVRVQDSDGILNARMLCDVRAIEARHNIKEQP